MSMTIVSNPVFSHAIDDTCNWLLMTIDFIDSVTCNHVRKPPTPNKCCDYIPNNFLTVVVVLRFASLFRCKILGRDPSPIPNSYLVYKVWIVLGNTERVATASGTIFLISGCDFPSSDIPDGPSSLNQKSPHLQVILVNCWSDRFDSQLIWSFSCKLSIFYH